MARIDALPHAIATETLPGGVRYRLPPKRLGKGGRMGFWFFLIVGLGVIGFMLLWMQGPIRSALRDGLDGPFDWFGLAFGLLGLPGLAVGLGLVALALWLVWGRTLVEVRNNQLHAIDKVGPFAWRRKRPIDKVRKIEVHGKMRLVESKNPNEPNDETRMTGLKVICEGAKPMHVFCGISGEQTQQLAETLAARLDLAVPAKLFGDKPTVEVVEAVEEEDEAPAVRDERTAARQPGDSPIAIDRRVDGLTLTVPPLGVFKNKAGLFSFGLLWCGFMVLFSAAMLSGMFNGEGDSDGASLGADGWGGVVFVALFALAFWAIGIGMLVAGWHMGRRRTVIDVVGDTLLFSQVSPLGQKQYEWRAGDIESLAFGPSGMESNDVPIMCIVVEPRDGKTRKLLAGRDNAELQWLAAVLRRHLRLSD